MVSCSTYQALGMVEDAAEKVKKAAEDIREGAKGIADDAGDVVDLYFDIQGTANRIAMPIPLAIMGEIRDRRVSKQIARKLGKGRKGGIL